MNQIKAEEIDGNLIKRIAKDWMLITAGVNNNLNTMTANWGGFGYLWNKPVVFIFVRPERYTFGFLENQRRFSLSFFDDKYKKALDLCGAKSGRDIDKIKEAELTTSFTSNGTPSFQEASLIIECSKIYANLLDKEAFIEESIYNLHYNPNKGTIHKMYIAEIDNVFVK